MMMMMSGSLEYIIDNLNSVAMMVNIVDNVD